MKELECDCTLCKRPSWAFARVPVSLVCLLSWPFRTFIPIPSLNYHKNILIQQASIKMPLAHAWIPWSDPDIFDDVYKEAYYQGREQLNFALTEFRKDQGYEPSESMTDEHWIKYWHSVTYICERR